jgi:serine/threonine protein kinase
MDSVPRTSSIYFRKARFGLYSPLQDPQSCSFCPFPKFSEEESQLDKTEGRLALCQHRTPRFPGSGAHSANVELHNPLKTGAFEYAAQVWTAAISQPKSAHTSSQVVIKIFDPLFAATFRADKSLLQRDVFKIVENAAYNEVEAYKRLRDMQGHSIPRFYGVYLLSIPRQKRAVYAIVIERISGASLRSLMHKPFTREDLLPVCRGHYQEITGQLLEEKGRLLDHGVVHGDFSPRNIMIRNRAGVNTRQEWPYCSEDDCCMVDLASVGSLEVCIIDFGRSKVKAVPTQGREYSKQREMQQKEDLAMFNEWFKLLRQDHFEYADVLRAGNI